MTTIHYGFFSGTSEPADSYMHAQPWRLYLNSITTKCACYWMVFEPGKWQNKNWRSLITQIYANKCSYCPSMWKTKLPCNGFVPVSPESVIFPTTLLVRRPDFKIQAGCFVCHQWLWVAPTVRCVIPRLSSRCHCSIIVHFLHAPYSACMRSWPEVIDSTLTPERYFVFPKVSLERARSSLPLCLPHATWTCSLPSSRYTTLAWRWELPVAQASPSGSSFFFCLRPVNANWHVSLPQVIYIGCAYATVYLIYMKFRATYDGNHDSFRMEFLIVPVGGLAVLVNHDFSFLEASSALYPLKLHAD